jgi:hypothetical protein
MQNFSLKKLVLHNIIAALQNTVYKFVESVVFIIVLGGRGEGG